MEAVAAPALLRGPAFELPGRLLEVILELARIISTLALDQRRSCLKKLSYDEALLSRIVSNV